MGFFYPEVISGVLLSIFAKCVLSGSLMNVVDLERISAQDLDAQILQFLNEDLLEMRKELTSSFVAHHSRERRDVESWYYQVALEDLESTYGPYTNTSFKVDKVSRSAAIFQDSIYSLEQYAIYQIEAHSPENGSYPNGTTVEKTLIKGWSLLDDFRVVATIEKKSVLFILVASASHDFTFLFTYSSAGSSGIVLRQRIRNYGIVTDAKFFIYYDSLYLLITHDNQVHSITMCPIFKWMGTYFDEIHMVQTRGANAVDTFVIAGHQYMAISQRTDATGNVEIGTQILRMDSHEDLEKVQLLYSKEPMALHFTQFLHEYLLIIGQQADRAVVYFFGGYDFIFLQHLPIIKGFDIVMVSILGPDGETYILGSNGTAVYTFSRAESHSPMKALHFSPYPNATYEAPEGFTITGLTVKPPNSQKSVERLELAITLNSPGESTLELYFIVFEKHQRALSIQKPPEDRVSKCLVKLEKALDESEPDVRRLVQSADVILRRSANVTYNGTIESRISTTMHLNTTSIGDLQIKPIVADEEVPKMSPAQILAALKDEQRNLQDTVEEKLKTLLLRNESRTLTGKLDFRNGVKVDKLDAENVKLGYLNGVEWDRFLNSTMKISSKIPQVVTGNWQLNNVSAKEVHAPSIEGIDVQDILLSETPNNTLQRVHGRFEFSQEVHFLGDIVIPPLAYINHLRIADIVNTTSNNSDAISGRKTADIVRGGTELIIKLVNGVKLNHWYDSVLQTSGEDQNATGAFVFNSALSADNVQTELLNGRNWDTFLKFVLINGENQTLQGHPRFDHLVVENLSADRINGRPISNLLTTDGKQYVTIPITLKQLVVKGSMLADSVNGLSIPNDVVMKNEESNIYGPVTFINLTTQYIEIDESAGVDDLQSVISDGKTVVYVVAPNQTVNLNTVKAIDVETPSINGVPLRNFESRYWKKHGPNHVPIPLNFSGIDVCVGSLKTENLNGFPLEDYITTNGDPETIQNNVTFEAPVTIYGDLNMTPLSTLNGIDISDLVKHVVYKNDSGTVYGTKTFRQPFVAPHGIGVRFLNGYHVPNDFVFLVNGTYSFTGLRFIALQTADVDVSGPIRVGGTVNGLNLTEVENNTVKSDGPISIHSDVIFVQNVDAEDFNIAETLNGLLVPDVLSRYILLDSGPEAQYIYMNLDVTNDVTLNNASNFVSINGINPSEYFASLVNRSRNEYIQGTKYFQGPVVVTGDLMCRNINGINLKEFANSIVSKSKPETISGDMTLNSVRARNINVSTICGIPLSDLVHISNGVPQDVKSPVMFSSANATVVKGNVDLYGLFNGINLTEVTNALSHVRGNRRFGKVTCTGDLTWKVPRNDTQGFTCLFTHGIKTTGNNSVVTGNVTFLQGFDARNITTATWLNGIDLDEIETDGIFRDQPVNFTGKNFVRKIRVGPNGIVQSLETLSTNIVNGINLVELNKTVVRSNTSELVTGNKTFVSDVTVDSLETDDINGCSFDDIAQVNDGRTIESILFEHVEGLVDFHFNHIEGFDWGIFLRNRVSLSSPQTIDGDWEFLGDVDVEDLRARVVNDLDVRDAVRRYSNQPQVIRGNKNISNLLVEGDIRALRINGFSIEEMYPRLIFKDKPRRFNQTVYLEDHVTFHKDIHIDEKFNEHDLERLEHRLLEKLSAVQGEVETAKDVRSSTGQMLENLEDQLSEAAAWLDYLKLDFDLGLKARIVRAAVLDNVADLVFTSFFRVVKNECGLPNGCLAGAYDHVKLVAGDLKKQARIECQDAFYLSSDMSPLQFKIISNSVSYNQTCSSVTSETVQIFLLNSTGNYKRTQTLIATLSLGFITDAKNFNCGGIDYVVISQLYEKGTSSGAILVYAVMDDSRLELVQTIPTVGTVRLSITAVNGHWYLGAANTKSQVPVTNSEVARDDLDFCETVSTVYEWHPSDMVYQPGSFVLLRDVATRNVIDVEFTQVVPYDPHSETGAIFVIFAHSISLVEIFKWDEAGKNFFLYQTIALDDEYLITSVSSLNVRDSTYLIVSSLPQGLLIYEYRDIEGFQLYQEVPLEKVYDVTSLQFNHQFLLPIASYNSIVAMAQVHGPAFV